MEIEYEATFTDIDREDMRKKLISSGAGLIKPDFLQKRVTLDLPEGHEIKGGWMRVRDEGDKITMSLKIVDGAKIADQKEICLKVDDFHNAVELLKTMGCKEKAFQESRRELWRLAGTEVTIDEWPFLEPYIEVEGPSEAIVKEVSEKLGFDWKDAKFCATGTLISEKYSISEDIVNNKTPRIVFDMENPFINRE
jgi:adenylate cyclase class 2